MDSSPRAQNDHHIGRRVRELYRYFQPEPSPQPTLVSSYFDSWASGDTLSSDNATVPAVSTASLSTPDPTAGLCAGPSPGEGLVLGNPNRTLSSFAQLAALRLGVQRVLISVSDRDSQHILANSTASPIDSGQTDGWSGLSTSNHIWSICKATVALPPSTRNPPQYRFLVIDDMSKDDRYASLPFVQGEPGFRFYAGTPLTTETNINIGCFFVLDTQPRSELTDAEKETLGSLGMIIMDYLKISRQAHEGRRATRLSRGLSCFVEGGRSLTEVHPSYMGSPAFPNDNSNSRLGDSLDSGGPPSRRSHSSDTRSISSESESKADSLPSEWGSSGGKGTPLDETQDTSWPFKRAANLLRESLELGGDGGVIFLEAGNNSTLDSDSGSDSANETGNPAPTLAISTLEDPFGPSTESKVTCPAMNLDRGFLLRLFRRYSKGRLWGFHRDGMLSSSDDDDNDESRLSRSRSLKSKTGDMPVPRSGKGKWKAMENKLLNQCFPNACQVLFVPLWNAGNSQWFSGCFCWNTVETRVFSPNVELSSVLGFGSSIMADYSRIQSLISDRQKGDFIGSISHELRSPLHGILAAAEFLQGTQLDEFQSSLLETVNACGRTLLDTMNQVLDFSKIVSLERTWRNIKRHKASPLEVRGMEKAHLDSYVSTDLAVLAEEVVEGVCMGHAYGQRATASAEQPVILPHTTARGRSQSQGDPNKRTDVEVMVDIAHNNWVYRTQPGALRRILMNILGNAMKYTDFGRVSIRLEVTEASESRLRRGSSGGAEDLVTLTVSDTGRGISEEFMRARLYTPFAQEDSLAVGTGLGLSIVRSLVRALNGSVNTYSRPGEGTMVKVTLPLERPQPEIKDAPESPAPQPGDKNTLTQARLLRDTFAGRRATILGVDTVTAAQHPLWSVIAHYVTEWYGLELVSWPPSTSTPVDLVLADEQMLAVEQDSGFTTRVPALLVVCNKSVDYGTAKTKWTQLAHSVETIRQPSGPHKLARSIRKSLESVPETSNTPMSIVLPNRTTSQDTVSSQGSTGSLKDRRIDLTGVSLDLTTPPELTNSSSGGSTSSKSPESESEPPMPYTTTTGPLPLSSPYVEKDEQYLPTAPHSPTTTVSELPQIEIEGEPEPEVQDHAKARVLVVDDNSINLKLMMTFMKKRDLLALDAAENGKIAVDAVERMQGYDLIFLDMSMPVMDGFEAARTIRFLEKENRTWRRATIIALTGLSSPRDEADALTSGVDLFLTKPVSFKSVARLVDEWEEKRRGNVKA